MQTFSNRNNLTKEYSGHEEASIGLRNRLLMLYGHPYSGDEFNFGIGNENWIHEKAFSKDLQMHFGKRISIENFRDKIQTSYNELFDFIEIYYARANQDLDSRKKKSLYEDICLAFINSGSVYEFTEDGYVNLSIDPKDAQEITNVDGILKPYNKAQDGFRDCIDGLITRSKKPKDIVGNMYVVFEEYLQKATMTDTFDKAVRLLKDDVKLHPTQLLIFEKLKAYRGDVWGPAHAGKGPEPGEVEALWYVKSIIAQIQYINDKLQQGKTSPDKKPI